MRYLFNRFLQAVLILLFLSVALFGMMSAMPGNPVDLLITSNPKIQPQDIARLKKLKGLDKPWYVQYWRWFYGYENETQFEHGFVFALTGKSEALGFSSTYKRPVWELLVGEKKSLEQSHGFLEEWILNSGRIGNTLQLMLPALLLALLMAIPLGIWSAYRQNTWVDHLLNCGAFMGISLPVFWFGIMMIFIFAEYLQLFPAGGMQTPSIEDEGLWVVVMDRISHAVLPVSVLSIAYTGRFLRYMRAAMIEVLPLDYVRSARAKGLHERRVLLKHAFRNALIPVVTVVALSIPALFGGAVLTETVFAWPGIGRLEYEAVMSSDYYVAIVVFLLASCMVMVGNLVADTLYVLVDPRMRRK